jgi:hypothetical protein
MSGFIYVLNRKVDGDRGEPFNQSVAVYANSAAEARSLVAQEFAHLRQHSHNDERAYGDRPEFALDEIKLDQSKVLIHWVTQ